MSVMPGHAVSRINRETGGRKIKGRVESGSDWSAAE